MDLSSPSTPTARPPPAWPWWRVLLTTLSTVGCALSGYLSWHYITGGSVIGCTGGSPCDAVLSSRWSSIAGVVPVSGLAAGAYLAMLVASLSTGRDTAPQIRRLAWQALLVLSGAAAGSAVWLTVVQRWIIGAFCPYCMTTHVTGVLLAIVVLWRAPLDRGAAETTAAGAAAPRRSANAPPGPRRLPALALALAGMCLAAAMAVAQLQIVPPTVYRAGESQGGLAGLDLDDAPRIGPPNAPRVVCLLFDYNCPHCQQLHFLLDEVVRRYGGTLAFALCPAPLNRACNPYVPRDVGAFENSCELARIALAVWVANRDAFRTFDTWMFTVDSGDRWAPRSAEAARAKAIALVGRAKFEAARSDPWIHRFLQSSIRLFGDAGGTGVPKLVFGSRWVVPQPTDADDLATILRTSLAVPDPTSAAATH